MVDAYGQSHRPFPDRSAGLAAAGVGNGASEGGAGRDGADPTARAARDGTARRKGDRAGSEPGQAALPSIPEEDRELGLAPTYRPQGRRRPPATSKDRTASAGRPYLPAAASSPAAALLSRSEE